MGNICFSLCSFTTCDAGGGTEEKKIVQQEPARLLSTSAVYDSAQKPESVEHGKYYSFADSMTDYERGLMAMVVYREARGESFEGMCAVAEIVLNRVLSDRFPNNINDVVYQKTQFSSAGLLTQRPVKELAKLTEAYRAVYTVTHETTYQVKETYLFFNTSRPRTSDYMKIGNHYFY